VSSRLSRRDVLKLGAAAGALGSLTGCDGTWALLGPQLDPVPKSIALDAGVDVDPVFHLLSRATYGPRPGDVQRVRAMGAPAWVAEQLRPEDIDDGPLALRLADCELVFDDAHELRSVEERHIRHQMERATVLRAAHTRRQLQEVMTGFWTDHFSIDAGKRGCRQTKPRDERDVIRPRALGRFRDLVRASALSPAMLIYLDGRENRVRSADEAPNENYARELLELHTLGVHGGYTQQDVMEAARCLTGWTLAKDSFAKAFNGDSYGTRDAVFRRNWHDDGEKTVLGRRIAAGGGEQDLEDLIDIVCAHPATARHIALKLCRRLVAESPPASIVASTAELFTRSDGDIAALVRHVLLSEEFAASPGTKVKRPLRFVVSALRAVGAEVRAGRGELEALERMGHVPYSHPTPDGYPEEAEPWMGTLLWRWNFALALGTNRLGSTNVPLQEIVRRTGLDARTASPAELAPLFLGRAAREAERRVIDAYVDGRDGRTAKEEAVALLIASPAFQVH
jgi:uncharacterized protein (DUF1800 family)